MSVLLVDGSTLVRKGLAEVLRGVVASAEVSEASTADEAVEVLNREHHDVALVDIRMPGRHGIELLREIRSTWPSLPVIILTCFDNGDYVKTALSEGAGPRPAVRAAAVRALVRLGAGDSLRALARTAKDDPSALVRREAVAAMAQLVATPSA